MELKALRISEKKAEVLHSMQIMRAEDLLTCYPFRYEHLEAKPRNTWEKEDRIIFEAVILNRARVIRFRGKQSVTRFKVRSLMFRCLTAPGCRLLRWGR